MVYINVEIISIVLDDEQTVYDQTIARCLPLRLFDFLFFSRLLFVCFSRSIVCLWLFLFLWFFFLSLSPPSCLSVCMDLKIIFSKYTFIVKINYARKNPYTNERNDHKQYIMEMEMKTKIVIYSQLKRLKKKRMLLNYCTKSKYLYSVHQLEFTVIFQTCKAYFELNRVLFAIFSIYYIQNEHSKFATKFHEVDSNFKRLVQSK